MIPLIIFILWLMGHFMVGALITELLIDSEFPSGLPRYFYCLGVAFGFFWFPLFLIILIFSFMRISLKVILAWLKAKEYKRFFTKAYWTERVI